MLDCVTELRSEIDRKEMEFKMIASQSIVSISAAGSVIEVSSNSFLISCYQNR